MRTTKAVLCAAALAAGAVSSMAQSNVYSLNVVGYVNVPLTGGGEYNMLCNPLNNTSGGNNISNLFAAVAGDGDQVFRWNYTLYDFDPTVATYSAASHTWANPFTLNLGEGVWYIDNNNNATLTFVGEVFQGSFTNIVQGDGSYNAIGSSAPIGGSFTNSIAGLTSVDGDQVFTWNSTLYDFDPISATYSGVSHSWSTTAPQVPPGVGLMYIRNGAGPITWVRNFTVQ